MLKRTLTGLSALGLALASSFASADSKFTLMDTYGYQVEASAGISSTYLFRGRDMNGGDPQVFGDLSVISDTGLYSSIWASSAGGDSSEFDIHLGWVGNFDDLTVNIGAVNYVHPANPRSEDLASEIEAYLSLAYNGAELQYYDNITSKYDSNEDYFYVSGSYTHEQFKFLVGHGADSTIGSDGSFDYTHLDISYNYNSNLAFTLSKVIDRNAEYKGVSVEDSAISALGRSNDYYSHVKEDDLMFIMSYQLPIEL